MKNWSQRGCDVHGGRFIRRNSRLPPTVHLNSVFVPIPASRNSDRCFAGFNDLVIAAHALHNVRLDLTPHCSGDRGENKCSNIPVVNMHEVISNTCE